jgi:hypothetical protein
MKLARYRKTIVAVLTAIAATAVAAANGQVTPEEASILAGAWLTVFGVYAAPNAPPPNPVETYLEGRLRTDPGEGPA